MKLLLWLLKQVVGLLFRVHVQGLQYLDEAGERALIIANHTSFLDGVLLTLFLPHNVSFAIHGSYAGRWWMRPVHSVVTLFSIDFQDPMAMKALIAHVQEGHRVVIFPEGRITSTGALMKVYPGPGMVADKAQADVIPVRISGPDYSRFSRMHGKFRLRWLPKITLTILPPRRIALPEGLNARERRHQAGQQLADIMMEMMFETSPHQGRMWDEMLDTARMNGMKYPVLEDIERTSCSYRELFLRSMILSRVLKSHCQPGSAIGLLLPNANSAVVAFFAVQLLRCVPAMLNFTMGAKSLKLALETANVRTVLTSRRFVAAAELEPLLTQLGEVADIIYLEDIRQSLTLWQKMSGKLDMLHLPGVIRSRLRGVSSGDAAVILFTSGSEGMPKGVVLSHGNILANVHQIAAFLRMNRQDVFLNALPMFHAFGLTGGTLLPLLSGAKVFLYPSPLHYRVIPEVAYDVGATFLLGTNVFLAGYAKHAHAFDFHTLRYVIAGAEKVQEETRRLWMDKFGLRIYEGYGATETSPVLAVNYPMHFKAGTVGRLLPGVEHRLEAVPGIERGGRLWVKGPNIMAGYLRHDMPGVLQPPADGWYDTGDIVEVDEEGFVTILGRARRFAKVAGEMVSLTLVEELAAQCWPDDLHAALSFPDAGKGEKIVLVSTRKKAERKALVACLHAQEVSELHLPRQIIHVTDIPLLGTGKIHYPALQALVASQLDQG